MTTTLASRLAVTGPALGDVLDLDNLHRRIDGGYITCRRHPDGGLLILDYSRTTQFEQAWDHETLTCRGLIVTESAAGGPGLDSRVVGRPYAKFFTIAQHEQLAGAGVLDPIPYGAPFDVFTKDDGSLGVGFLAPDGRPAISTRGSFASEQARWATGHLRSDPAREAATAALLERGTPCFEIISPVSRIVKHYDQDGLILHGVLDPDTGRDLPLGDEWPERIVQIHPGLTDLDAMAGLDWDNEEGFVVRFRESGLRVKVKFATYLRLHRIVTGATPVTLWEHLAIADARDAGIGESAAVSGLHIDYRVVASVYAKGDDPITELLDRVPDEFDTWVRDQVGGLQAAYAARHAELVATYRALGKTTGRREFAAQVTAQVPRAERGAVFALRDGRDIRMIVWCDIRPASTTAFFTDPGD